jgi:hypothetical protein
MESVSQVAQRPAEEVHFSLELQPEPRLLCWAASRLSEKASGVILQE